MAGMHPERLRSIIRFTLEQMDMHSPAAEGLLLGTAAHESQLGHRLIDHSGRGRGLYRMEPATESEIWRKRAFHKDNFARLSDLTGVSSPSVLNLQFNPMYSTIMANLHYRRVDEPLPSADDLPALADYWDRHWNRRPHHIFPAQFIINYRRLVLTPQPYSHYTGPTQLHLDEWAAGRK